MEQRKRGRESEREEQEIREGEMKQGNRERKLERYSARETQ